jgi:peptide/nickel transport system permease protein
VSCAIAGPSIVGALGYDPYARVTSRSITPPTPPDRRNVLGTDSLGRDQLARLVHGSRVSLQVGFLAEGIALLIGATIGALAGYAGGRTDALLMRAADLLFAFPGGRTDALLMRAADLLFAFPAPLVALAVIAAVPTPETVPLLNLLPQPSVAIVFLVLGAIGWTGIARLVRGEILKIREQEFAQAATAIGAPGIRVVLRHLLPGALGPLIVTGTLGVGGNILMESWLSFLGIGARPPLPSWGTMVTEGQAYFLSKPWVCIAPGLAILVVVLGFNLLGDGIRDRLDPRQRPAVI